MRQPSRTEPHPNGGTFSFYVLDNGAHVSVLDDGFEFHEDFEIHERDEDGNVIQFTELRAADWDGVRRILDQIEAR